MTAHRLLPSEVEPDAIADLIDDCHCLPSDMQPGDLEIDVSAPSVPHQRSVDIRIPDAAALLVAGYDPYGG